MFAERLKLLRKQKGVTQKKLAEFFNVSQQAVGMWEIGQREPDIETLKRLADYFEVDINYLTGHVSHTTTPPNKKALPNPEPDIKWGDFGISFYDGGKKKLTQKQKDRIAKVVQLIVMEDMEEENNK